MFFIINNNVIVNLDHINYIVAGEYYEGSNGKLYADVTIHYIDDCHILSLTESEMNAFVKGLNARG